MLMTCDEVGGATQFMTVVMMVVLLVVVVVVVVAVLQLLRCSFLLVVVSLMAPHVVGIRARSHWP